MSDGPVLTLWVHCGSMSYCGRTLCCLQAHQIISPATVRVGLSVYYDTGMIDHMWQCFRHIERYNIMYNICRISKKAQVSMTVSWTAPHKAYKCSPDSQTHKIKRFFKGVWILKSEFLPLVISLLLLTVVCWCSSLPSAAVQNVFNTSDRCYPGHSNEYKNFYTMTSLYRLTPQHPQL